MNRTDRPTSHPQTTLKIDPEFQARCGKLQDHELELLRQQLKAEGCRDTIKTWNGAILDGHTRCGICKEENISFEVEEIDLPDREHALHWIDCWQAGRRNEDKADRDERIGRIYEFEKKHHGGDRKSSPQNEDLKTAERVAKRFGVSRASVERNAEFVRGLDKIEADSGEEAREEAKRTKTKQEVRDIGKGTEPEASTEAEALRDCYGKQVPQELAPVFAEGMKHFRQVKRLYDQLKRAVDELHEMQYGRLIHLQGCQSDLKNSKRAVMHAEPHALCPYCLPGDKECGACKRRGWVNKDTYDAAPARRKT